MADSFPLFLQQLSGAGHEFGRATQVPVGARNIDMAKIRRERRQLALHVFSRAIPAQQGLDRESMAEVV
jgi:hypothetical protein